MVGQEMQGELPLLASQSQEAPPESVVVLWYLDNKNGLGMMRIQTGVTNGIKTEIVQNPSIKEGMKFISGVATQDGSKSSSKNTRQPPGPHRLF